MTIRQNSYFLKLLLYWEVNLMPFGKKWNLNFIQLKNRKHTIIIICSCSSGWRNYWSIFDCIVQRIRVELSPTPDLLADWITSNDPEDDDHPKAISSHYPSHCLNQTRLYHLTEKGLTGVKGSLTYYVVGL